MDDYIITKLKNCENVKIIIPDKYRARGIISILVDKTDFNNERFIKRISNDIALSTGSACSLGEPSHVIKAIGLQDKTNKVIRVSLNKYTTKEDIDFFVSVLLKNV